MIRTSWPRFLFQHRRGEHIPLGQLATLKIHKGPPAIKSENARLNAWIQVSIREDEVDLGSYVALAQEAVRAKVDLPAGYSIRWSGRYEYMERARQRLMLVLPLTLLIIFFLLYMHFKNITEVFIVLLAIPFSLVGGVWLMYFLGYNMSVAVAVGFHRPGRPGRRDGDRHAGLPGRGLPSPHPGGQDELPSATCTTASSRARS